VTLEDHAEALRLLAELVRDDAHARRPAVPELTGCVAGAEEKLAAAHALLLDLLRELSGREHRSER
jgi:hypothetical protein